MKYLLSLILTFNVNGYGAECIYKKPSELREIKHIRDFLKKHVAPKAVPPEKLAPVIYRLSKRYKIDGITIARVIVIESRGIERAINKRTQDYGIMQVSIRHGYGKDCLLAWQCNLEMGVRLLAFSKRICRYNVGSGPLIGTRLERCLHYENKLLALEVR